MDKENKLILYKDNEGKVSVNTRFADDAFVSFSERWLGFNPSCLVSDPPIAHWHIPGDNRQIMSVIQQLNPGAPTYLEKRKPKVLGQRLCF